MILLQIAIDPDEFEFLISNHEKATKPALVLQYRMKI
jgi:hypothetical protein